MANKKKNRSFSLNSYAKINLYLDVLKRREDGYHQIRTIFSEIDLHDTINFTLTKRSTIKILTNYDFVNPEDNIIYRVALFLKKKYDVGPGVRIELVKRIPVAAGLGGGSSNAAQTIIGLSRFWDLNLSEVEMNDIAGRFGSDINFFLYGGTAQGENRGEIITRLDDLNIENILLVNPGFGITSGQAYQAVELGARSADDKDMTAEVFQIERCYNALQSGVCRLYPGLKQLIEEMETLVTGKVILSGSGPTVIGFCSDRNTATRLAEYFSQKGYWSYVTKTMKRSTK